MKAAVDWTPVDLLISQLMEVMNPHNDAENIQEVVTTLNNERSVFSHSEDTLRTLVKGEDRLLSCILELQAEVDEQESSMELSRVIEEQRQQVNDLIREKEKARLQLEQIQQDIRYVSDMCSMVALRKMRSRSPRLSSWSWSTKWKQLKTKQM